MVIDNFNCLLISSKDLRIIAENAVRTTPDNEYVLVCSVKLVHNIDIRLIVKIVATTHC